MIRNLLYSAYCPTAWPDVWRDNIARLNGYADTFNGRKLVLIKHDARTAPVDDVRALFSLGSNVEFRVVANHARRHEAEGFLEGLETLQSTRRDEATFYAHTKGCSKGDHTYDHQEAIRQWRNRMYYECLHDVPRIERVLEQSAAAGAFFRSLVEHPQHAPSKWAYAGTYYWMRHDRLFEGAWRDALQDHRMGPELFPGTLLRAREAARLFDCKGHLYYDVFSVYTCPSCDAQKVDDLVPERCDSCGFDGPLVWIRYCDLVHAATQRSPQLLDLLNRLTHALALPSYLEVASENAHVFDRVRAPLKQAAHCATDLAQSPERWGLILLAGRRSAVEALAEIDAALQILAPGGVIVVEGCNPKPGVPGTTTWQAWARLRAYCRDLQMHVVNPIGCGVIRRGQQELIDLSPDKALTWDRLARERTKILNLTEWHEWLRALWLSRVQPGLRVVS